jgi:hypothetical protein
MQVLDEGWEFDFPPQFITAKYYWYYKILLFGFGCCCQFIIELNIIIKNIKRHSLMIRQLTLSFAQSIDTVDFDIFKKCWQRTHWLAGTIIFGPLRKLQPPSIYRINTWLPYWFIPHIYLTELNCWEEEIIRRISTRLKKIDCGRSSFESLDEGGWTIDRDYDDSCSLLQFIEQLKII